MFKVNVATITDWEHNKRTDNITGGRHKGKHHKREYTHEVYKAKVTIKRKKQKKKQKTEDSYKTALRRRIKNEESKKKRDK